MLGSKQISLELIGQGRGALIVAVWYVDDVDNDVDQAGACMADVGGKTLQTHWRVSSEAREYMCTLTMMTDCMTLLVWQKLEANRQKSIGLEAAMECREAIEAGNVAEARALFTKAEVTFLRLSDVCVVFVKKRET